MMQRACNIDRRGRIARAVSGALTLLAAALIGWMGLPWGPAWLSWMAAALLAVFGGFQLYEARKGWCIVRAMGLRTPM